MEGFGGTRISCVAAVTVAIGVSERGVDRRVGSVGVAWTFFGLASTSTGASHRGSDDDRHEGGNSETRH
jgi:hypothetical protein